MLLGITEEIIARQPPEAQAIIRLLLAEIARLEARVKELEGGRKTPQNSSLPPSTVHPHAKPASTKRKSKKKRGGQPGHKKHERPLIPTEECDEVKPLKPTRCRRCGEELSGSDPDPLRHQVWELPEIKAQVTEYQRHRLACPSCGETTCADLPCGVPQGQSGGSANGVRDRRVGFALQTTNNRRMVGHDFAFRCLGRLSFVASDQPIGSARAGGEKGE
jgi:transposase